MIEPTVGRKVWYRPYHNETQSDASVHGMFVAPGQPLDATIVAVWGPRCVNLFVVDSVGGTFAVTSRTLLQDDDIVPGYGGYAEWMPFQKGQAKKHEGDEASAVELAKAARALGGSGY